MTSISSCSSGFLKLVSVTFGVLLMLTVQVVAQQQEGNKPPEPAPPSAQSAGRSSQTSDIDERYRIGSGDVLNIRVFNRAQLSLDGVRVDGRGMIRMPLIKEEIRAVCRTEGELAQLIAADYQKYLRNPQVDVFVREYQSQPVALIGAVNSPGRFQLQRRIRLLELLSFAGGPGEQAGRSIQIIHAPAASRACEPADADDSDRAGETALVSYDLSATLRGEDPANPYLRPGDIVTLPEAEQAFVVGNVLRPGPIVLKENITVTQAIARVGGTLPDTKNERIRIIRQSSGKKTELYVDLKAINKHEADDLALQANDIIDVPTASGKRFLRTLVSAIAPAASRLPVRVIP